MANKNPWLGLASYEEPKNDNSDYKFCGRDEETMEVVRLIDNNLFITLYGSSGIGKTSLLKSGVIPILRKRDYYPVYIRLSQEPTELSYAEAIIKRLIDSGLREERSVKLEHSDGNDRLYLWNYFATTRWINADGNEVYPVMILDQFEEVFRDADKKKAELLLKQMYLLLNDELEMPDEEGYSADTNYRFVASIREDFLFVLEDSIDAFGLDLYKSNRYRLRAMKPENARQVVLVPGRDCIEESDKEKVADKILKLAKKPQSDDIDTLLLSLVCAGTFDKKIGDKITLGDLSIWKDNPMQVYYQDAVKTLNANQIRYIQQNLIREDGSRRRVDVKDLKEALGDIDFRKLVEGKNRLFSIGDKGQAELLHDKLAMAVYEERKAFEERERKKKFRRRISAVGVVVIAIAVVFFFQNWNLKKKDWKMMEIQSMFVGEKILDLSNLDSELAMKLAVELLPQNVDNPTDRPYTIEAEVALREAANQRVSILNNQGFQLLYGISPDDRQIVTTSLNGKISIKDAESGEIIKEFDTNSLFSYSPDSRRLLFGTNNGKIIIRNVETGETIREWEDDFMWTKYSPDGNNIMYTTGSKIIIREISTGEKIQEWADSSLFANFNSDGKQVVSVSNGKILIRDVESGNVIYTKDGKDVEYVDFTQNDKQLLTVNDDGDKLTIKSIETDKDINSFSCGDNLAVILGKIISPDYKHILLDSKDGEIRVVDIKTGKEIYKIPGNDKSVYYAGFSNDGDKIFYSSMDGKIRVFNIKSAYEKHTLTTHTSYIWTISCNPADNQMISASNDGTVRLWDIETGKEIRTIVSDTNSRNTSVSYSQNNKDIVLGSYLGHTEYIKIVDTEDGKVKKVIDSCSAWPVLYSPDGKRIVGAAYDSTIRIWDAESGHLIHTMRDTSYVEYVSFSPDSRYVVSSLYYGKIRIWDVDSEEAVIKIDLDNVYYIPSISFSPDGKRILSAQNGLGGIIAIYDVETGDEILSISAHNSINCAAYSPDGKYIASVSDDNTIKVWDAETGEHYVTLNCYDGNAIFVTFTPDSKQIITSYPDGTIRIWDFPPLQELIDQTRERFKNRPLTDEEKKMYYLE